jgi:hypothetical protein
MLSNIFFLGGFMKGFTPLPEDTAAQGLELLG